MGFPIVAATNTSSASTSTTPSVSLPSGIVAGDLLLAFVSNQTAITGRNVSWPAGWTELYDKSGSQYGQAGAYRVADGSEGASITVTMSGSVSNTAHITLRITGVKSGQAPEAGAATAVSSTANPDPPSLTPSWGSDNDLWIAIAGGAAVSSVSAYPTNYADNQLTSANSGFARIAVSTRNLNAASEDPGTYTWSGATNSIAETIAIRGAPASLITSLGSFQHMIVR